jgi:hypothetical protein
MTLKSLARRIQWEDLALAVAVVGVAWLDRGAPSASSWFPDALVGLACLVAAAGAILALATRRPGESTVEASDTPAVNWALIGPLVGGITVVAGAGVEKLGGDGAIVGFPVLIVAAFAVALASYMPVLQPSVRRALVSPFVLVAGSIFSGVLSSITSTFAFDGESLGLLAVPGALATLGGFFAIIAVASGIFYLMLIVVPRELANPGSSRLAWIVRFALFFGSLILGILLRGKTPVIVV